jgi:hypothetical protein
VVWFRDFGADTVAAKESILIKVTSVPCFNLLVPSAHGFLFGLCTGVAKKNDDLINNLSRSIHGLYMPGESTGLVQLLPNLCKQGFRPLCPELLVAEGCCTWETLWSAFCEFTKDMLIPLADLGYVHSDVRPGIDETSNLLFSSKAGIRMIDLDSLSTFAGYRRSEAAIKNARYIRLRYLGFGQQKMIAEYFVYLQMICVAESWLKRVKNDDVNANALIRNSGRMSDPFTVDRKRIEVVLVEYQSLFDQEDSTKLSAQGSA